MRLSWLYFRTFNVFSVLYFRDTPLLRLNVIVNGQKLLVDTLSNDGGSLVVEDNVWSPDVIRRHVETLDPAILLRLPGQLVVAPVLLHPQVGRHDLVLQILKSV